MAAHAIGLKQTSAFSNLLRRERVLREKKRYG
jgi:hypothetical protein